MTPSNSFVKICFKIVAICRSVHSRKDFEIAFKELSTSGRSLTKRAALRHCLEEHQKWKEILQISCFLI